MSDQGQKSILLVEDEILIAMSEKMELERKGYIIHHVTTGEKALEVFSEKIFPVDLVLMDIDLGTGIDGTQAAKEILNDSNVPIVFLSSHTEPEVVNKTEKITSYGYVVKNSGITVLDASIKMAFKLFDAYQEKKFHEQILQDREQQLQDVNQRLVDESNQVRASEEKFRTVIENSPFPMWISDENGTLLIANKSLKSTFNLTDEQLVGKYNLLEDENLQSMDVKQKIEDLFINHNNAYFTIFWKADAVKHTPLVNSRNIWIDVTMFPILNDENSITNIVCQWIDITENKKSEEELKESEAKLKNIIESSTNMFYIHSADQQITFVSPQVREILGYEPEEVMNNWRIFITDNPLNEEALKYTEQALLTGKRQPVYEMEMQRKDGKTIVVEVRESPVMENGNVVSIVGSLTDITERKESENRMKRLLRNQETLLNNDPSFIIYKDTDNNIIKITDTVAKMTNLPREEIEGKPSREIYPTMAEQYYKDDKEVMDSGVPKMGIIEPLPAADGTTKWLLTNKIPVKDDDNRVTGIIVFSTDITDLKETQNVLRESEQRLLLATKSAGVGIWDWDIISNEMNWDERIFQMYGITDTPEHIDLDYWKNCLHPDDRDSTAEECMAAVRGEKDYDVEFRVRWPDGTIRWMKGDAVVIRDDDGKPVCMIGTNYDITEHIESEKQTQKQLEEKEILLHEVHHRVKNNVANIESFLSLQVRSTENPDAKEALKDAASRVKSMRVLYDNLLLTKVLREISIKSYLLNLIDAIRDVFPDNSHVVIEEQITDFKIAAERAITIGIIINEILTNAFKYAFKDSSNGSILVVVDRAENIVTVSIQDNGIGIDEKVLEKKSPGFGLTIIKMLSEQLGGTYSIKNINGTRSTIQFEI